MKKYFVTLCFLGLVLGGFSQSAKNDSLNRALINELRSRELETYKKLVETAEQSNQDLRETTNWFLAGMAGFVILVLGSQIFYNVQLNTRKLEAMRGAFAKELEEYKANVVKGVDAKVVEVEGKIEEKAKEHREQLNNRFDLRSKLLDSEITVLEKDVERGIKSAEARLDKLDAEVWILKGVESNALSGYLNSALKQEELNRDLKYLLEDIIKVLSNMSEVWDSDAEKLKTLLKLLEEKHKLKYLQELGTLKKLIREKNIYSLQNSPGWDLLGGLNSFWAGSQRRVLRRVAKKDEGEKKE